MLHANKATAFTIAAMPPNIAAAAVQKAAFRFMELDFSAVFMIVDIQWELL